MKRLFLFFSILFISNNLMAALPPYYQSAKEIIAVLNNSEVAEKIGSGRLIHSVTKTEGGYIINAGNCTLTVNITYSPRTNGMVGPAIFEVHPDKLDCPKKS
jgi:hypothetical protein